jgi:hypothetical protein
MVIERAHQLVGQEGQVPRRLAPAGAGGEALADLLPAGLQRLLEQRQDGRAGRLGPRGAKYQSADLLA